MNRYCKLQSMQTHIIGCSKRDFNKIILTNSNNKSHIQIYGWTHWATRLQHAQLRRVGNLPSNRTRDDGLGLLQTWTAKLATVRFGPGPGPEMTFRNNCSHQFQV